MHQGTLSLSVIDLIIVVSIESQHPNTMSVKLDGDVNSMIIHAYWEVTSPPQGL